MKTFLKVFGIVVAIVAIMFALEVSGIAWTRFFNPQKEDVKRKTFEQTQSYVHGKIQDLAKMYREYKDTDSEGKETIKALIQAQFFDFDAETINEQELKTFLITMRGY